MKINLTTIILLIVKLNVNRNLPYNITLILKCFIESKLHIGKGVKIMDEILKFITEAKTFYIATVDGDKPKVRPFGFIMKHEGKLYFGTNNQKDVYKQLIANPHFEISTMSANGDWIRLQGKAVFDASISAKAKAFEVMPMLANMYTSPDNPIFEVFYIAEGEATMYSFSDEPRTITL